MSVEDYLVICVDVRLILLRRNIEAWCPPNPVFCNTFHNDARLIRLFTIFGRLHNPKTEIEWLIRMILCARNVNNYLRPSKGTASNDFSQR